MDDLLVVTRRRCWQPTWRIIDYPRISGKPSALAATIEQAVWRETAGRVKNLCVEVSREGVPLTGRRTPITPSSKRSTRRCGCRAGTR